MIRAEPDVKAKLLGHKRPDDQVVVSKLRDDGWVELAPEEEPDASEEQPAYMLVNGKSLGLGVLLEPVDPSLDA